MQIDTAIFKFTKPPSSLESNAINRHARWLTWSDEAVELLAMFCGEAQRLPNPNVISLPGGSEFSKSFSIPLDALQQLKCFSGLVQMASTIRRSTPGEGIFLFRDLLNKEFRGEQLGKFLTAMREVMVFLTGELHEALYAPLSWVGPKADEFPLHADLYAPNLLWNIFDRVPRDGSGAARLLPVPVFKKLLKQKRVPMRDRTVLLSCLNDNSVEDRFRIFYELLHVNYASWTVRLNSGMKEHQFLVPLGYGQGYLINDRRWLHGRNAPTGGVTTKRVHRLVFFSADNRNEMSPNRQD
jgi:hypothetical protein